MMSPKHSYASVFPLPVFNFEGGSAPSDLLVKVHDSIRVEDVSKLMQQTPPGFWTDWSFEHGEREAIRLKNTRYALVRRFECVDSEEMAEKETSKNLLYRLYLTLKVICPTKARYLVLHYDLKEENPTIRNTWRNEFDSELLDCEFGFPIRPVALCELAQMARESLDMLGNRTLPVTQATYNFEIGHRAEFVNVRHMLWVAGLEALFSSREWQHQGADVVKKRVGYFLGDNFVIYPDQRELGLPRLIGMSLRDVLGEIFDLRNHFAHGTWPDKGWAGKVCRPTATGVGHINYSGMLLEAAAATLRGCLRKILGDEKWINVFNDKAKMNSYFASRGLIRERKRSRNDCNLT